jgi:hypothetical protein
MIEHGVILVKRPFFPADANIDLKVGTMVGFVYRIDLCGNLDIA